jgi:iron-sulfur cluster assembly protein
LWGCSIELVVKLRFFVVKQQQPQTNKRQAIKLFLSCFRSYRKVKIFNKRPRNNMVTVTEKAKDKIFELRNLEAQALDNNIRVGVVGGGCSGLMYNLEFDTEVKPTDQVVEDKGVKIVVDKKSLLYLVGTVLDFSDGLNGKGFQFVNPNASRTCGCGESFSV